MDAHKGHRHPHGQGVDAGGNGQHAQPPGGQVGGRLVLLPAAPAQGLPRHLAADDGQQAEGYPVVHRLDVLADAAAQQPAQKGHKKLKRAEPQTHLNGLPGTEAGDGDAAGHGYREGVQRQAHGNQENLNQTNHLSAKYC